MKTKSLLFILPAAFALTALTAMPSRADEKGEKILKEAFKNLHEAKAMTAKIAMTIEGDGLPGSTDDKPGKIEFKGKIAAMKPNMLRFEYKGMVKNEDKEMTMEGRYLADGKDYYTFGTRPLRFDMKSYTKGKLDEKPTEFLGEWEGEVDAFFGGEKNLEKGTPKFSKEAKVGETDCDVIEFTMKATDTAPERVIMYYVGQKDHLIHKASYELQPGITQSNTLMDINLKPELKAEDFKVAIPEGATEIKPKKSADPITTSTPAPKKKRYRLL